MKALGSLVIDEQIVPIVELYLEHGALWASARVRGPMSAVDALDYRVLGRDGREVLRGTNGGLGVRWPALRAGDELHVDMRLDAVILHA